MEYELLLINVVRDFDGYAKCFQDSIGQYNIASYLVLHHFKAYVFSGTVLECKKRIEQEIVHNKVPMVGFYTANDNFRITKNIIKWLKTNFDVKTVVGGPQADALDLAFFQETGNDFGIIGEGEIPVKVLLEWVIDQRRSLSEVPSLLYLNHGVLTFNQAEDAQITDLDLVSYPKQEHSLTKTLRTHEMVGIITGRGCPYHCTFCYEGATKKLRFRTIESVAEELDYIKAHNPNLQYINIYDDTFTVDKDRVLLLCKELKKRDIKWFCEGHVSFIVRYPEVVKEMIDSGLVCIQFGIESGSDDVLKAYNKSITSEMIVEAVSICKNAGVAGITGNFIVGGAQETFETIQKSKELFQRLLEIGKGIIELYLVYFAPYPNTEIVKNPCNYDINIEHERLNYTLSSMCSPVVSSSQFSTSEIYDLMQDFKALRNDLYLRYALASTKQDFLQGLSLSQRALNINRTWSDIYSRIEYFSNFAKHIKPSEQLFHEGKYIIRTFEDYCIKGDTMVTQYGSFTGVEKIVLLNATGVYTAREVASQYNISIDDIRVTYEELNNRCFAYISEA